MDKEVYFELRNNSGDIMTIYRDEPNVVPFCECIFIWVYIFSYFRISIT